MVPKATLLVSGDTFISLCLWLCGSYEMILQSSSPGRCQGRGLYGCTFPPLLCVPTPWLHCTHRHLLLVPMACTGLAPPLYWNTGR
ncbi:hypothetical protein F5148DRAFT_1225600 [Russula earlei]|uniref:Uncharacterized protein n=1 Tax=Russula earlei TaxID=71964 RepID=A0ACC0U051_9AGAM|nr:hypothetical protein F5148DRAFT_1225600 [Russula earlei]